MAKKEDRSRSLFTGRGSAFLDMASIVVIFLCIAVEHGQAELMKKLAFTDGLTQIANRAAFELKEEEIRLRLILKRRKRSLTRGCMRISAG